MLRAANSECLLLVESRTTALRYRKAERGHFFTRSWSSDDWSAALPAAVHGPFCQANPSGWGGASF